MPKPYVSFSSGWLKPPTWLNWKGLRVSSLLSAPRNSISLPRRKLEFNSHHTVSQFPSFKSSAFSEFQGFENPAFDDKSGQFSPLKTENMRICFCCVLILHLSQLQERNLSEELCRERLCNEMFLESLYCFLNHSPSSLVLETWNTTAACL